MSAIAAAAARKTFGENAGPVKSDNVIKMVPDEMDYANSVYDAYNRHSELFVKSQDPAASKEERQDAREEMETLWGRFGSALAP